ncbi:Vesicle-fusing_ATPase [Hexamita inflata]|uniref:Vesicle-fusing ATPase n=1 Tax=Hexamita inflata TaxID=28002 RepID=A0AA86R5L7_9EUKA|nr:Vesicle-fusing ATPase [Hexamita inflata]CAI9966364.1 Vesicle-fusing ATPase [Hexamita inflata]
MPLFTPEKAQTTDQAKQNCVFMNTKDYDDMVAKCQIKPLYVQLNGVVFLAKPLAECPKDKIMLNANQRKHARISLLSNIQVEPYAPQHSDYTDLVQFAIVPRKALPFDSMNSDLLQKEAISQLIHRTVYDQPLTLEFEQQFFDVTAKSQTLQIVTNTTFFKFSVPHPASKNLQLTGDHVESAVVKDSQLMRFVKQTQESMKQKSDGQEQPTDDDNFELDIEFLGVGGCNKQFADIFRRAFVPRLLPPQIVKQYQMQMVRGLVLYGPPGTGKTLIARKIGEILNAKEPKLVSGPEILNAYVGKSEENIRNLFADAEKEYEEKGDDSELHLIIMDELDAICKQRGSRNDSTGTGDSIVNQLLAKMDGVKQINNVLVIGMTNRLDLMDEALLRPGRFEIQVEIHLPDKVGREQIFRIHTKRFVAKNAFDPEISIEELAELTPNYSGAEIQGVVNAALSYAQTRMMNAQAALEGQQVSLKEFRLLKKDFIRALKEVKAGFGKCDDKQIQLIQQMGFLNSAGTTPIIQDIQNYIQTIRNSSIKLGTVLLHSNSSGTGKSSIAAEIAKTCGIEFVKFISAEALVLKAATEMERCNAIVKAFQDAYKVPEALIILDGIEDIIMYTSEGMRFSNQILTTMLPLLKRGQGRLIVIGTTSKFYGMQALDVTKCFYKQIHVDGLDKTLIDEIVQEWCESRNIKWEGGKASELQCIIDREIVTIRALLQSLEQAASGCNEVQCSDFGKFFENTW